MLALLFVAVLGAGSCSGCSTSCWAAATAPDPRLFLFAVLLVWAAVLTGKKAVDRGTGGGRHFCGQPLPET